MVHYKRPMSDTEKSNESDHGETKHRDLEAFEALIDDMYSESQQIITRLRWLKNNIPRVKSMYRKLHNNIEKGGDKKKTGLFGEEVIPDDLAEWLGEEQGTKKTRVQVVSQIIKTLKENDRYYTSDKRVLRADDELIKILKLPKSVNKQTDPKHPQSLSIYTVHKFLAERYRQNKNEDE